MSADDLIQYLSWAIYVLIFVVATIRAVRRPLRANVDIALLFAVPALIVALEVPGEFGFMSLDDPLVGAIAACLIVAMVYLLLRLVDDFSDVPVWLMRSAEVALGLLVIAMLGFALSPPEPRLLTVLFLTYLIGFLIYAVAAFVAESQRSTGVTRRRMRAAAIGSLCLCATIVIASMTLWFPGWEGIWSPLTNVAGLASGICYFLGFAPPGLLRRAWQEPELRAFLGRAASLPRLPDTGSIIAEMERGAATAVGAPHARIGLWDEPAQVLRFSQDGRQIQYAPGHGSVTGRAFLTQRAQFTVDVQRDSPPQTGQSRTPGVKALLAAPVTAGQKRLGVLVVYAPHAPVFADEDLDLVQLLADQAAVILESRSLIDEAARVQAREEVARLKEDFLSAAAHDLKTPLTTLVGQAQLLEKRVLRALDAPVDLTSVQRLVREAQRLSTLVLELLDATRAEQGRLVGEKETVDLAAVAQEVGARHNSPLHPVILEAHGPVVGEYDPARMVQLMENLVENAVKYSPEGGEIRVKLWSDNGWNRFEVSDNGIGIPPDELPNVFDRFHRGANVSDRRFTGMGLGLYICRGIAEQHGGQIWVDSRPNKGSTFHVALPACTREEQHDKPEEAKGQVAIEEVRLDA